MASPQEVTITSTCQAPADGVFQLPKATREVPNRVVVEANIAGRTVVKLLQGGLRPDNGTAACVTGTVFAELGGGGGTITYRSASYWDAIRYRPNARWQFAAAILTLVGAIFSAVNSYLGDRSTDTPGFTANAAPIVLLVATLIAFMELRKTVLLED